MKYLKRLEKVSSAAATAALVIFTAWVLSGIWQEKQGGEPFFVLGYKPVLVLSDSMEPTMPEGRVALVREYTGEAEIGDVVLFQTVVLGERTLVTHRIVGKEGERFITKGDNNRAADTELLDAERIRGIVLTD